MTVPLTVAELKKRSTDFVDLLGNKHDTTSETIVGLLDKEFAVQHRDMPPSQGGRDAFLGNLTRRLKLAHGLVSVDIKHVVAETSESGVDGGQCWVYSRKNFPFGCTDSLDIIIFTREGRILSCKDLHGPAEEKWYRTFQWLLRFILPGSFKHVKSA